MVSRGTPSGSHSRTERRLLTSSVAFTSALAELGRLAGLLQPVLAALLHARVAGEEAGPLQGRPELRVDEAEGARDPVAHGPGLARDAAALDADDDVVALGGARHQQGLLDEGLMLRQGEIARQGPVVDHHAALAGEQ